MAWVVRGRSIGLGLGLRMRGPSTSASAGLGPTNPYFTQGAFFDGTNDWLTRGGPFSATADSSQGMLSFWYRPGVDGVGATIIRGATSNGVILLKNSNNTLRLVLGDNAGVVYDRTTVLNNFVVANGWRHIIWAWDTNFGAGLKQVQCFVNGVSDVGTGILDAGAAFQVKSAMTEWGVATTGIVPGTALVNGDLADFYMAYGQLLDISIAGNLAKFRSAAGKPMNLGADGSTPTGSAPTLFLRGGASAFPTNVGTGGGMTLTGALTDSTLSPSI